MVILSEDAKRRIDEVCKDGEFLRVLLIGGGCHGFSYKFDLDSNLFSDDFTIKNDDGVVRFAMKEVFVSKIKTFRVDFVKTISASYFVLESLNFETKCGCGTSFSLKES